MASRRWEEQTTEVPEEWLVPTAPADKSAAEAIGHYHLCFELAAGGMATVYLARYEGALGFEKVVAVKRIHPHLVRERKFVEMFFDEARIAAFLEHPYVCRVLDFGQADDSYFLAMEFLLGEPLSEIHVALQDDPRHVSDPELPDRIARIAADVCEGLHAAHELTEDGEPLGIVHRDVNPANLFALYDGTVRVVDFGIAKAKNRVHHTEAGLVKGKYAYVAPEQLKMKSLDRRCDIWGMGVVCWEMLTGKRLFKRDDPVETIRAVTTAPIPAPSSVNANVPPALDAVVLQALARDPHGRYATAREMAADLDKYLGKRGHSVAAREIADWLEELFPGATERKQRLVELTRHGDTAVPVGIQGMEARRRDHERTSVHRSGGKHGADEFMPTEVQRVAEQAEAEAEDSDEFRTTDVFRADRDEIEAPSGAKPAETEADPTDVTADDLDEDTPDQRPSRPSRPKPPASARKPGRSRAPLGIAVVVLAVAAGAFVAWRFGGPPEEQDGTAEEPTRGPGFVESDPAMEEEGTEPPRKGAGESATGAAGSEQGATTKAAGGGPDGLEWRTVEGGGGGGGGSEPSPGGGGDEAVAAAGEGRVHVMTHGGWAEIRFEGKSYGRTPKTIALPGGKQTVTLVPYGDGDPRKLRVDVRPGRQQVLGVTISER